MRMLMRGLAALMMCLVPLAAQAENHKGMLDDASGQLGVTLEAVPMNALPAYAAVERGVISLARVAADDAVTGAVLRFYDAQSAACWGRLFPSAMADEASPFHLCTHGTLAAVKALADRLAVVMPAERDVAFMAAALERKLREAGAADICASSRLVDMGVIVSPDLGTVAAYYLPTMNWLCWSMMLVAFATVAAGYARWRPVRVMA